MILFLLSNYSQFCWLLGFKLEGHVQGYYNPSTIKDDLVIIELIIQEIRTWNTKCTIGSMFPTIEAQLQQNLFVKSPGCIFRTDGNDGIRTLLLMILQMCIISKSNSIQVDLTDFWVHIKHQVSIEGTQTKLPIPGNYCHAFHGLMSILIGFLNYKVSFHMMIYQWYKTTCCLLAHLCWFCSLSKPFALWRNTGTCCIRNNNGLNAMLINSNVEWQWLLCLQLSQVCSWIIMDHFYLLTQPGNPGFSITSFGSKSKWMEHQIHDMRAMVGYILPHTERECYMQPGPFIGEQRMIIITRYIFTKVFKK